MVGLWPHSPPATVKNLFTAAAITALTVTAPVVASAQYRYQWSYQDFQEYQRQQAEQARAVEQQREQAAREQAEREQAAREQQEELARQQRQTALAELRERQRAVSNQQYWLQHAGDTPTPKP